ncbi:MAG TPA: glycosyltransferase [Alphaproteobacteria bacterium]|nr:glycosyltransferase [Alphaproteobacteria bacterium]
MIFHWFWKKNPNIKIAVIDSQFPQARPMGFRNSEINAILRTVPNAHAFAMRPMRPGADAWFHHGYGVKKSAFRRNFRSYLGVYPENAGRISYLPRRLRGVRVVYSYFLAETYTLLPYLNKNKLPFVFVLYPGGGFGLNNASSDAMLRAIFTSPQFRRVIVTQPATRDYLIDNNFCTPNQIEYLFGSYAQFSPADVLPKQYYPADKDTIDICFVACKYSPRGIDKGYDLFIDAVRDLIHRHPNVRAHVVGNFNGSDIDVSDIRDKITFHGLLTPDALRKLYTRMDICISPNRPYKLFDGNFDGFPLGLEAMVFSTVLMTTDELNNNRGSFDDGRELIVIKPDATDIIARVDALIANPQNMYEIGRAGAMKLDTLMNPAQRSQHIIKILETIAGENEA